MKVEQLYTGCLAQGAYYIESNGEVAIIDPLREVNTYIEMAKSRNAKIKYIFETHFHADFVSGHVTLSEKTGAPVIYGPNAQPSFECIIAQNEQTFKLGKVTIKILHTPGHTMESSTFLLLDETGKEHAIFSGDTLFLGDVGRPDLAQKAADMTQEQLAGTLFDSLRQKIMTLPDDVIVYPGHGAGSACGKNMSNETIGTLGDQKATNYALRGDMSKEEFIKEVTTGLTPPPAYFPMNVMLNKSGYQDIDKVKDKAKHALSPDEFEAVANDSGAIVLDVRDKEAFSKGFVPRSIFIGLDGNFAPWVGSLIKDIHQPILLVTPENKLDETITRLSRVGFDNVLGYLKGGVESWKDAQKEIDTIQNISAIKYAQKEDLSNTRLFDVRRTSEYNAEKVIHAKNTPLESINQHQDMFMKNDINYLHCATGYRSVISASILKSRGIHNLINIEGGFEALKQVGLETSTYICPSKT